MSLANRGKHLEQILDHVHAGYMARGAAYVLRTPPPVKVLSAPVRGVFRACFEEAGPCDYLAVVDGVPLVFDAKECNATRWPLSHLPTHQAAHFDGVERAGGRAAVLLSFPASTWVVPWTVPGESHCLRASWRKWVDGDAGRGEASVSVLDVGTIGVHVRDWDWLRAWKVCA